MTIDTTQKNNATISHYFKPYKISHYQI